MQLFVEIRKWYNTLYRYINMPEEFRKYLWDADFETLDMHTNKRYVIARVLEHGDIEDAKKILSIYPKEDIIDTIKNSTEISTKTAYFFKSYFNITDPIQCLILRSTQQQKMAWPY